MALSLQASRASASMFISSLRTTLPAPDKVLVVEVPVGGLCLSLSLWSGAMPLPVAFMADAEVSVTVSVESALLIVSTSLPILAPST